MTELVEDPQPTLTSSEYIRRWQEQSNRLGRHNATYRRTKAEPPKGDA